MFSILWGTVIGLLICWTILNYSRIRKSLRFWILMWKLPTLSGRGILTGHALQFVGLSKEKIWKLRRKMDLKRSSMMTVYIGPTLPIIIVYGPDISEALLAPMLHLNKATSYQFLHSWLHKGLLTNAGAKWQRRRKILTPAFHFSILRKFVDTFNRETRNFVRTIESKHLNEAVDVVPLIFDFTILTMSETSMGINLDLETADGMRYKDGIKQMAHLLYKRFMTPWLWNLTIFNMTSLGKQEKNILALLHGFTNNIIQERTKTFEVFDDNFNDTHAKKRYPLLDILLNAKFKDNSIDETGIREEVDTFMFEGHDTTGTCLNFTTMLLAVHKNIQEAVYKEIIEILGPDVSKEPSYNDLHKMNLLERCIKESLRLYPPVPFIGRTTGEDIITKYGVIPKGAMVYIQLFDLHRNKKYWPNPHLFDPSRFLPENSQDRHPFVFLPFSAGPRNCIGQRFAMLEMKAFFCGILRKFILEPVDTPETLVVFQDLLLRTKNGIKVKFVLRNRNLT